MIAVADEEVRLRRKLEGNELGLFAQHASCKLIRRRGELDVCALRAFARHARKPCLAGPRVRTATAVDFEVARALHHDELILELLERRHRGTELEVRADPFRSPVRLRNA